MVHALQEIRNLLKPNGVLIDIRPNGELVQFIRPLGNEERLIGYLQETDDYIEYHQAEAAMQEVVAEGLFQIKKAEEFTFHVHADSFTELKTYIDENWSDAFITEEVIAEAKRLDNKYGVVKILLREKVHIFLLASIPSPIMAKQAAVWQSEWN